MQKTKKFTSWMLFLAGIGFVGWGASLSNTLYSNLLLSFGGAISGAGLSQIVNIFSGFNFLSSISESIQSNFRSSENKIEGSRTKFHHYHLTEINSELKWRYSIIDFSHCINPGILQSRVSYVGKDDKKAYYNIEAGFRDERLVFFIKAEERDEPTIIEIYPFKGKDIQIHHCGLLVVESWDETHLISRCILSKEPILGWKKQGSIDDKTSIELDKIWKEGIRHNYSCLSKGSATVQ